MGKLEVKSQKLEVEIEVGSQKLEVTPGPDKKKGKGADPSQGGAFAFAGPKF
jgi:hypothetical protein